jgi:hypothetical protein
MEMLLHRTARKKSLTSIIRVAAKKRTVYSLSIKGIVCLFGIEHPPEELTGTWADGLVSGRRPAA